MIIEPKNYETPETGEFLGTIIDVIDVGKKMTPWGEKHKLQIAWVLNALDSQGKPFRILREMPISMNEKSNLYQTARDVFAPQILPPGAFETEWLVGRANRLFIKKELPNDKGRVYANIISIMPLKAGDVPPVVPGDYVRAHLRQVTAVNPQARPAAVQFGQPATASSAPAQPAAPAVQFVQSAPAPGGLQFPTAPLPPLQSLPVAVAPQPAPVKF